MKVLVFHIGHDRYALPLAKIDRVLPVAALKALPGAPGYVRGLLDLHGEPVPVIDLSNLAGMPPNAVRYDTRILLIDVPAAGGRRRIGVKAERVTGVETIPDRLEDPGVIAAPWLGKIATRAGTGGDVAATAATGVRAGMLQLLDPERLLTPDVARLLFGEPA
jgi:chemotaxis-related protein WspB